MNRTRKITNLIISLQYLKWSFADKEHGSLPCSRPHEAADYLMDLLDENTKLRAYVAINAMYQHGGVIRMEDTKLREHSDMILGARQLLRELDREAS